MQLTPPVPNKRGASGNDVSSRTQSARYAKCWATESGREGQCANGGNAASNGRVPRTPFLDQHDHTRTYSKGDAMKWSQRRFIIHPMYNTRSSAISRTFQHCVRRRQANAAHTSFTRLPYVQSVYLHASVQTPPMPLSLWREAVRKTRGADGKQT